MLVLYTVGIAWHCLHPIASVLTGDFQHPRRWYIDESALDPSHFQQLLQYDIIQNTRISQSKLLQSSHIAQTRRAHNGESYHWIRSLCDGLSHDPLIPCYRHTASSIGLEIAQVNPRVPASAAAEAIVLVIPPILQPFSLLHSKDDDDDKSRPQFHASVLQLIHRLQYASPWLSKMVLVVAPIPSASTRAHADSNSTALNPLLEETVVTFLDAYLGSRQRHQDPNERLPMELTGAILRTLLVVDLQVFDTSGYENLVPTSQAEAEDFTPPVPNELRILPQGRRGLLPNMDLVFLVRTVYDRSSLMTPQQIVPQSQQHRYSMVRLVTHIYDANFSRIWDTIEKHLPAPEFLDRIEHWAEEMFSLVSFCRTLAIGPTPPHAPALDRGIDALTIQGHFQTSTSKDDYDPTRLVNRPRTLQSPQEYPRTQIQRLELVLRGLSNIHERLHHSTRLYLLVSPDRFVKHEEYLIPNLLLVLPLLVRIAHTVWYKQSQFNFLFSPFDVFFTVGIVLPVMAITGKLSLPCYVMAALALGRIQFAELQTAACILATILHVGLAFGHVSLSAPSALVWTPLLAFPESVRSPLGLVTSLFILGVQVWFHSTIPATPYILCVVRPLALIACVMYIVGGAAWRPRTA